MRWGRRGRRLGEERHTLSLCALTVAFAVSACALWSGPGAIPRAGTDSHRWYYDHDLQTLLNKLTRSREISGNSVELLINGKRAFERRYENLTTANFVLVKTFIWTDDEAGRRLADALIAKAHSGVPVMVQYDVKGNLGSMADITDMLSRSNAARPVGEPQVIADLREAGVFIVATNSPGRPLALQEWWENTLRLVKDPGAAIRRSMESLVLFDHCDHDKYFVTVHEDGVRAIMGGLNIASEYAFGGIPGRKDGTTGRGGWRDTDIEILGPAANAIVDEYLSDIERHLGKPGPEDMLVELRSLTRDAAGSTGSVDVRFVVNNPLFKDTRHIDELYRILIYATPKNEPIFLSTPYFAPSKRLRKALLVHMNAGGSVTVLTNSYETNDIDILTDAARYAARELMQSPRFRLYERISRPDLGEHTLHHKVASFGLHGPIVIGSPNLDAQSTVHNGEALVVIQDPLLRRRFDAMVAIDTSPDRATHVVREELEDASTTERIRQFMSSKFAWYWL